MRCEQIRGLLSPYIDNMTNKREKEAVEAHIVECVECRKELEELQAFCAALKKLDSPVIPGDFSQELHKRLLEEKSRVFAVKNLKKPRKTGWIAAGVAGIALVTGIYASSLLPPLGKVAIFQDKEKGEPKKPSMAVEDILERIEGLNDDNEIPIEEPVGIAEKENVGAPISGKKNAAPETAEKGNDEVVSEDVPEPELLVSDVDEYSAADVYLVWVKVNDIEDSLARLIEIADNHKAEYSLIPDAAKANASSDIKSKELVLKLDGSNLEAVLNELRNIGEISEPEYDEIVLSEQLAEANQNISFLKQQLEAINSDEEISEEEQARCKELESELRIWQEKKAVLEKDADTVTLKVYLVEEVAAQ